MDVREILDKHREIDAVIDSKLEQISELKSLATKVTPSYSLEGKGNGVSDRVGRTVARIVDLENEINEEIDKLVGLQEQIRSMIELLDDYTLKTLLERRYLLHEGWETVADKMGYSSRHITRLHIQAIDTLNKLYNQEKLTA